MIGYYDDPRPDVVRLMSPTGRRVLDVGCGAGVLASALKQRGAAHVAGIELNAQAAGRAARVVDQLVTGSVVDCPLPFGEGEFDYVLFADVLEHLPNPEAALARCLPFLAPDGKVIVSVPNMRFYLVLLRLVLNRWTYTDSGVRDQTHLRIFTLRYLRQILARQGLEIERVARNFRLLDDQSSIGRAGAAATRVASATIAPALFPDLLAYQYVVVARHRT